VAVPQLRPASGHAGAGLSRRARLRGHRGCRYRGRRRRRDLFAGVRARGSRGDLRQQLAWFAFGAGLAVVANLTALFTGLHLLRPLGVVTMLLGLGLAIFRYRLYDVDRLINRTLVYGLVTVAAFATYDALAVVLGSVVGGRSAVIATIGAFVVALVLRPLGDLSQRVVERTFDRRNYNAVRMLRALEARVGHENIEPGAVVAALRRALRDPTLDFLCHVRGADSFVTPAGDPAMVPADTLTTEVDLRGNACGPPLSANR
jgi:hypothetical protein